MSLDTLLDAVFSRLLSASVQAALLTGLVWLLVRLCPRLPAALRCMLWWLVGAQLVLGLCWQSPLQLRVLPPAPVQAVATGRIVTGTPTPTPAAVSVGAPLPALPNDTFTSVRHRAAGTPPVSATPGWRSMLMALWLAGVLLQVAWAGRQWRQGRRALAASTALDDATLNALCHRQSTRLGLRREPALRTSPLVASPLVTGLRRPVVLLPAGARLSTAEAAMAVAHELAHLRRGDLWLGWIPALAQRLFFFHPLALLATREYALSREAACDAMVIHRGGVGPRAYGDLLLRLGIAPPMRPGLSGASSSYQNLKRRLIMLQHDDVSLRRRMYLWLPVTLLALAGVMPWRVTARPATPASAAPVAAPSPHPQATRPAPHAVAATHAAPATVPVAPTPPQPPAPPTPPPPPAVPAPPPPPPPADDGFSARHVDIDTSDTARDGFALLEGDSVIVEGTNADEDRARELRHSGKPLLYLRRGTKAWIIRDPATLRAAEAAYAPVTELAREQGRLAGQQGELAGRQAALAGEQAGDAARRAALAQRAADIARVQAQAMAERDASRQAGEQARLQARHQAMAAEVEALEHQREAMAAQSRNGRHDSAEERARAAREQAELARKLARLSARQQAMEAQVSARQEAERDADQARRQAVAEQRQELARERAEMEADIARSHADMGARQRELGRDQEALGARQRALSKRQQRASEQARQAMTRVLDEAIAKGLAKPVSVD